VLWLLADNPTAADNLRREAAARGVDPGRLVFAAPLPPAQHLARYRCADLFLDTFPCGAHTTASDALWLGVPVLTLAGESMASRVAASLLHAAGLAELVTATPAEYESLAVELATDAKRMARLSGRLRADRDTMPLFDTPLYTAHLEEAYATIYDRWQSGREPDDRRIAARGPRGLPAEPAT
jgi:protein O-GlcNAc transferase